MAVVRAMELVRGGRAAVWAGNRARGLRLVRRALAEGRGDPRIFAEAAHVRMLAGAWADAAAAARAVLDGESPPFDRAYACFVLGRVETETLRDPLAGEALLRESLRILEELDNAVGLATVLAHLAAVHRDRGELDAAEALLARALEIATRLGQPATLGFVRHHLGRLQRRQGRLDAAEAMLRASYEDFTTARYPCGQARALNSLGIVCQSRGQLEEAERCHRSALALFRRCRDRRGIACCFGNLGRVHRLRGNIPRARRLLARAVRLRERARSA